MPNHFKCLSVLGLAALLAACGQHGSSGGNTLKGDIAEKIERPGGGVAAITTREAGDAKTPVRFHVYIQKSQDPAQAVEVLDMDKSAPPQLTWIDGNGLKLDIECGQIRRFSNFADVWSGSDQAHSEQIVVLLDNRGVCPG